MANTIIKAGQIVEAAALLLQREIVLPRLVWSQSAADFAGAKDDTITLRVPAVLDAKTRAMRSNTALVFDDFTETKVDVSLDTHLYTGLNIRDEELTLDIQNFARQVLSPQMRSVAEGAEDVIATTLEAATPEADDIDFGGSGDATTWGMLTAANAHLNNLNVPRNGRVFVAGANVEAALLSEDKLVKVNESGTTDALREAQIARAAGFTIVGSNAIDPDRGFAFHQTAVALAIVAPSLPEGASMAARVAIEAIALRYLRDYNPTNSTGPVDRSLVDCFIGATSVEDGAEGSETNKRLVKVNYTGTGPIASA